MKKAKKVMFAIILAVMVILSSITTCVFASEKTMDINKDGKINVFDLIISKRTNYSAEEVIKITNFLTAENKKPNFNECDECIISGISMIKVSNMSNTIENRNSLSEIFSVPYYYSIKLEYNDNHPILSFIADNFTYQLEFEKLETFDNKSFETKDIISTVILTDSNDIFSIYSENNTFKLAKISNN